MSYTTDPERLEELGDLHPNAHRNIDAELDFLKNEAKKYGLIEEDLLIEGLEFLNSNVTLRSKARKVALFQRLLEKHEEGFMEALEKRQKVLTDQIAPLESELKSIKNQLEYLKNKRVANDMASLARDLNGVKNIY